MSTVVIGDCYVDVVCENVPHLPRWGKDTHTSSVNIYSGGSGGNTSVHLAALGKSVTFYYAAGKDEFGRFFEQNMKQAGVNAQPIVYSSHPTATCVVLSGADDRAFVSCPGSNEVLEADALAPLLESLPNPPELIHFGGYFCLVGLQSPQLVFSSVVF
jgi:sugar/nucleoside kinase (ribokinase family)